MKHRRYIAACILAAIVVFPGLNVEATSVTKAKDVPATHWAYDVINQYVKNGYVNLSADGKFYPSKAITRAEVAEILVKTLKLPLNATIELNATDLPTTHPQYKAFQKLIELGIFDNAEKVNPAARLTRGQMAKIIALSFNIEVDPVNTSKFKDYSRSYWAVNYIESLADEGIIQGKTKTTYGPNDSVTKAQVVGLVSRGESFSAKVLNYQCAYDLLSHKYIDTKMENKTFVQEVIRLVNNERTKVGLNPLQEDLALDQLATVKMNDIFARNYFDHASPYYGMPWEMANYFDYEFRGLGENLARNLSTPASVMQGWMTSPKHKENILKRNYTHIGVAVKRNSSGNYYWVQLFSTK